MSPVKNRIGVGVESYVVFDADGEEGQGDLYAGSASGGKVFRVTWSRVHESSPALSPDGLMLAFIRGARVEDSASYRVWVMNLLNGAEREMPVVEGSFPRRVAWSLDGSHLFVETSVVVYQLAAPPDSPGAQQVDSLTRLQADTALSVPLGDPVSALAEPCENGGGICVLTAAGSQVLSATGRDALRWGADSVGYFQQTTLEVRPLSGGTTREVRWSGVPENPRTATQFPGRVNRN